MGVDDWRLPPLPDLDPPAGWEDLRGQAYTSLPPQDQMGNAAPSAFGQPRPLLPPQRSSGRGANSGSDRRNHNSGGGGWSR